MSRIGLVVCFALCTISSGCGGINTHTPSPLWSFEIAHANIPQPDIPIYVNGELKGQGNLFVIHRKIVGVGEVHPAIVALYSSGYLRVTPLSDPGSPFGTSVILGPAYWSGGVYNHNPSLSEIRLRGDLQGGVLVYLRAKGKNGDFDVSYKITIDTRCFEQDICQVDQEATALASFSIDEDRQQKHEGFKLVQLSSMYLDSFYHDADFAHCMGKNGYHRVDLVNTTGFLFPEADQLLEPWLEIGHSDQSGWQGATPSVQIYPIDALDQISVQGWSTATDNPNDDNIGAWLNWDDVPPNWQPGTTCHTQYQVVAHH
jgi:hypothetical protein